MGRPTDYTQAVADAICERIAEGESLRAICREDETMPAMSTVFRWLASNEAFSEQYARAREEQAEALADEIVSIADEVSVTTKVEGKGEDAEVVLALDPTAVARNRLRVDARKWVAAKLKPKKYGDKMTLAGDPESPLQGMSEEQIDARLNELMRKAGGG